MHTIGGEIFVISSDDLLSAIEELAASEELAWLKTAKKEAINTSLIPAIPHTAQVNAWLNFSEILLFDCMFCTVRAGAIGYLTIE